ncbi:cytochrome P450 [Shouchella lonarensis]|uniref:Cytochrome P450 n=1 Tax=Shouchella lonarensis TaxID=1464122 RepID=A0A1G6N0W3_9BACI|nr:cytochrome P450 [Shouchella lonarensis]SDC61460.1 Cytochrome P450 [Shouchella lonarensis]
MLIPFFDMLSSDKTMELPIMVLKNIFGTPYNYMRVMTGEMSLDYAVEESARLMDGLFLSRFALEDVQVGSRLVRKGDKLSILISKASQDSAVFECPHMFSPNRSNLNDSLSFGVGDHQCLGKNFTNQMIKTLVGHLLHQKLIFFEFS